MTVNMKETYTHTHTHTQTHTDKSHARTPTSPYAQMHHHRAPVQEIARTKTHCNISTSMNSSFMNFPQPLSITAQFKTYTHIRAHMPHFLIHSTVIILFWLHIPFTPHPWTIHTRNASRQAQSMIKMAIKDRQKKKKKRRRTQTQMLHSIHACKPDPQHWRPQSPYG